MNNHIGRPEEATGLLAQLLVPSTVVVIVHFLNLEDIEQSTYGEGWIVLGFYVALAAFSLLLLRNRAFSFLLAVSFVGFYVSAIVELYELFNIEVNADNVISRIDHPLAALVTWSCLGLLVLQIFTFMLISCQTSNSCCCSTKALILTFTELILSAMLVCFMWAALLRAQTLDWILTLLYMMSGVLVAGQIMICYLHNNLVHAFTGMLDSFQWSYIRNTRKWAVYTFAMLLLLSGLLTSYSCISTQFQGFHGVYLQAIGLGLYNGFTFSLASGIIASLVARGIRACRKTPAGMRNHDMRVFAQAEPQRDGSINIEFNHEYGYMQIADRPVARQSIAQVIPRMEEGRYIEQNQHNYECPICIDEFDESNHVTIHTKCKNGFHTPCLGSWLEAGHKTCPLCRAQIL